MSLFENILENSTKKVYNWILDHTLFVLTHIEGRFARETRDKRKRSMKQLEKAGKTEEIGYTIGSGDFGREERKVIIKKRWNVS